MDINLNGTSVAYLETEDRPWGSFFNLADGNFKMKIIKVKPGQELSVQSHNKRSEKWICLEGILTVNLGENLEGLTEYHLMPNQTIDIPRGYIHQAKNKTTSDVMFFELQTGTYFGEDDIIRYSDVYGRS
ncbi:MAG: phosphomannose isomerase type II C-terminal cupin domain [Patescibacteria group bacterium]